MKSVMVCVAAILMAATQAQAQEPISIKLGVLTDLSGPYADLSGKGSITATQMAAEDFRADHPEFKIEVVSADHQNKADVGAAIASQWYERDGVDAVLDITNSAVALAVNKLAKDHNKVFLASGPASTDLTGKACSPNTVHWTYDTYALSHGTGVALTKNGGDKWFFIAADYAFGAAIQRDTSAFVESAKGQVVGSVSVPLNTMDFSSFLLQAQSSGANVLGLANAGGDMINTVKQAAEFGLGSSGMRMAALLVMITDVHSLGLEAAQGLVFTEAFYWDLDDGTRSWSRRFAEHMDGRMPTTAQAGAYSAAMHYLKAVAALKSKNDGAAVVKEMKAMPTDDPILGKGTIRPDGRHLHDMYLFEVKKPAESKGPWDYYKQVAVIPASEAFKPMNKSVCNLVP